MPWPTWATPAGEGWSVLESFGVSAEAETTYHALLRHPGLEPTSAGTGLEPQALASALDELRLRGLVLPAECGEVEVVPPERALTHLIDEEERRLSDRLAGLSRSRQEITEVVADYLAPRAGDVGDHVEVLEDPEHVRSRIFQLSAAATESVWAVHPGAALSPEQITAALISDRDIAGRGLDCRMIITPTSLGPAHWADYLEQLQGLGHQLRVHEAATQVCLVFDRDHAVIPTSVEGVPPFGAYVLKGRALTAPVAELFEQHWATGAHYAPADGARDVSTERIGQVVALLARGIKDEAVARRLGVSTRTMRRLVAATMEELGAQSRFQAGIEAVRRGYVE